jgi:hypothetical protein
MKYSWPVSETITEFPAIASVFPKSSPKPSDLPRTGQWQPHGHGGDSAPPSKDDLETSERIPLIGRCAVSAVWALNSRNASETTEQH